MAQRRRTLLISGLLAILVAAPAAQADRRQRPIKPPRLPQRVPFYNSLAPADRKVCLHAFDRLWDTTESRDWTSTRDTLRRLLASRVIAGPDSREALAALTYTYLFAEYATDWHTPDLTIADRSRFERWLLAHSELAVTFTLALTDDDQPARALDVLYDLYQHSPNKAYRYPELSTAIAIVHDGRSADAERNRDTFDWLTNPRIEPAFDIRKLPHELTRYLVGVRVSRDERLWAYDRYRRESNMDNVYRDVEYDRDGLSGKRPKQIAGQNYTLENLQAYGGTCGDQAYYASQIGRCLGFPMAEIEHHAPGIIGHCWCLQLSLVNQRPAWRPVGGKGFGWVVDPATGRRGSDQALGFLLSSVEAKTTDRRIAAALTETALRVDDWRRADLPAGAGVLRALTESSQRRTPKPRATSFYKPERQLEPLWLIQHALAVDPYHPATWHAIEKLAAQEAIRSADLTGLMNRLATLTGNDYADVLYAALLGAYRHLPPADARRFLETARQSLTREQIDRAPELAANLHLIAGDLFTAEGEFRQAMKSYDAALAVDPDYPPIVLSAVRHALPAARETGDVDRLGDLCQRIFDRDRKALFGLEIGRTIAGAGLPDRAIEWLRYVYDRTEIDQKGHYDALRQAVDLLARQRRHDLAAQWSLELYEVTQHPADGIRTVTLLHLMGNAAAAEQLTKRVEAAEAERRRRVAEDADRRAGQTR